MKKLIMIAAMAVFGLSSAQEGFKLGAHIGVPVADAGDVSSFPCVPPLILIPDSKTESGVPCAVRTL